MDALTGLLGSRTKTEVLRLLFGLSGQELHVREIARRAGRSHIRALSLPSSSALLPVVSEGRRAMWTSW